MKNTGNRLLVEGSDDKHVVLALCSKYSINENFEVIDCKGIDELFKAIPVRMKQSDLRNIGIVVDADSNLIERWEKIKSIFEKSDFNLPEDLPDTGLIVKNGLSKIGVWVMPNNNLNGMLEDFISFLVPDNDLLLPLVKENLELIEKRELNKYAPIHKSKAQIHSWLALQEVPGTPMGLSITKRYLTTNTEACHNFTTWLTNLFKE